jgi:ACS family sodium-dependent inorganic phosphate cotransporter
MSWRNPTIFLGQAATGASDACRGVMQLVSLGRGAQHARHAHASDDAEAELEAALGSGPLASGPRPQTPWPWVVALSAISVVICYADRSNISTAIIPMSEQFGWEPSWQGLILSMFFVGYLLTQLLGGALADRYGGKGVLAAGVAIWSLTTCLTPPAAFIGLPALIGMRIAMGLGEGVAFPAIHSTIARSVPLENQSTAVGVVTAASYVGTALAFGLAPTLIEDLGWPWVFYLFGASAALWLPFWLPLRIEGGSRSGGSSGSSKSFNVLSLFSSSDAADSNSGGGSLRAPPSSGALGQGSRLQRVPTALSDDLASEAETEWSDGVAVGFKVEQQRRLGVGFTALLRTKPVWAICVAQYTGSWGFYGRSIGRLHRRVLNCALDKCIARQPV